jgi:metal-responsive CopG/Arc/MetJ family transcriptional regulator
MLRGDAKILKQLAEKLLSINGVKHGKLTLTSSLGKQSHSNHHTHKH